MPQAARTRDTPLDPLDRRIINRLQESFPLDPNPFDVVATEIGCTAPELISRLQRLLDDGTVTRFGPFFDAEAMGGAFCLCAMAVPRERFNEVVRLINGRPEVAHNYERDHDLNVWFVLATESPDDIAKVTAEIEHQTGIEILRFPKLAEFFIGFKVTA